MSAEIQLRPSETSIARPTELELRELIRGLPGVELTETAPMECSVTDQEGSQARLVLEGGTDGVELIRILPAGGDSGAADLLRVGLEQELGWAVYDPRRRRWLGSAGVSSGSGDPGSRRAIRFGIMMACAGVLLVAVVLWHVGHRRNDLWLGVIVLAAAVYFGLRVWGFVERLSSRGPGP